MRTREFEERVLRACGKIDRSWSRRLIENMKNIKAVFAARDCTYAGEKCERMVKIEIDLVDETKIMIIAQRNNALKFSYFCEIPDEKSEYCLDKYYEQALIMSALKQKAY